MPINAHSRIRCSTAVALAAALVAMGVPRVGAEPRPTNGPTNGLTTGPTTAPTPTTRRTPKLYSCLLTVGGGVLSEDIGGLPPLQQVDASPGFANLIRLARRAKADVFVDYEDEKLAPLPGIAKTNDVKQLANLDAYVAEVRRLLRKARTDLGDKHRRVGIYTVVPIGRGWQYGDDQSSYVEDNRRVIATGLLDEADMLCVGAYVHIDDIKGMTPQIETAALRSGIKAARLYNKPIVVFICPHYVGTNKVIPVPDSILDVEYAVAYQEGVDICVWCEQDSVPNVLEKTRRAKAAFARATTAPAVP